MKKEKKEKKRKEKKRKEKKRKEKSPFSFFAVFQIPSTDQLMTSAILQVGI